MDTHKKKTTTTPHKRFRRATHDTKPKPDHCELRIVRGLERGERLVLCSCGARLHGFGVMALMLKLGEHLASEHES